MEADKLKDILEKHERWIKSDGESGERADLRYADLRNADLSYANLSYADLRNANLRDADLRDADLRNADLSYANLSYADLRNADLRNANLSRANFRYADLRNADFRYANLSRANLRYADLRNANLSGADLLCFAHNRHTIYFTHDNHLRIGCEYQTLDWWVENYKIIGEKENYTEIEIMSYKAIIDLCVELQKKKGESV